MSYVLLIKVWVVSRHQEIVQKKFWTFSLSLKSQVEQQKSQKVNTAMHDLSNKCAELLQLLTAFRSTIKWYFGGL